MAAVNVTVDGVEARGIADELVASFEGDIQRVKLPLMYRFGILLVCAVMILLPLIYIALIGLACFLVYYHMVNHTGMLGAARGRGAILMFIAYLAPLVIGGILILFMIKPLFARSAARSKRRSVTRDDEPILFAFVDRLCRAVGAPRPRRIDVDGNINASASFRSFLWSLVRTDLVLTIGMPLVAGLTLRQFAGVLAHEFGHFSQGAGMRLTYVIRTISHWFTRVVYERDQWDEWLAQSAGQVDIRVGWVLYLAQAFVWLTRKILWCLMIVGHGVSGFMLRQMEFDADRHEARLAGSDTFESTARTLFRLNVAWQGAQSDLGEFYRDGRLADNLPRLILHNMDQIPPESQQRIDAMIDQSKTGYFDTHPCDRERIASAHREAAPGVFRRPGPASVLFMDFDSLARDATYDYYREIFGPKFARSDMHAIDELLERQKRESEASQALDRYFQGAFTILRPLDLPTPTPRPDEDAITSLRQLRERMLETRPEYQSLLRQFTTADSRFIQAKQADALLNAKFRLSQEGFEIPVSSAAAAIEASGKALAEQEQLSPTMKSFEEAAACRLATGLALLDSPQVAERLDDASAMVTEARRLTDVLAALNRVNQPMLELRTANSALAILCNNLNGNQDNEALISAIRSRMQSVLVHIRQLKDALANVAYPFDHAKGQLSVGDYVVPSVPLVDDLGGIYEAGGTLVDNLVTLHVRVMARIASICEHVETAIGLPRMEPPTAPAED